MKNFDADKYMEQAAVEEYSFIKGEEDSWWQPCCQSRDW